MTAPVPEEHDEPTLPDAVPPGEHDDELPGPEDADGGSSDQADNAESSQDQPSQ